MRSRAHRGRLRGKVRSTPIDSCAAPKPRARASILCSQRARLPVLLGALLAGTCLGTALAQDATWLAAPSSGDFNTAANWDPASVPTGIAVFGASNITTLTFSGSRNIDAFQFNGGAPAYTFNLSGGFGVQFNGDGIVNASSNAPTFNLNTGFLNFDNAASAGNAVINVNAGTLTFLNNSTAGNAQITAAAGTTVDFSTATGPGGLFIITAGSIAGGGNFALGANQLVVGSNNLSTTVSGVISGNALTKEGTGTLTLSGVNTYTGLTTVNAGVLAITNVDALGTGPVLMNGGTLSVTQTLALAKDITFFDGSAAALTAAAGTTLTFTGNLQFNANSVTTFGSPTDSGTILLNPFSTSTDATAAFVVAGGTLSAATGELGNMLGDGAATTVNSGATVAFNDNFAAIRNLAGAGTVDIGVSPLSTLFLSVDPAMTVEFSGTISGAGGVEITGDGTQILSGNNTYTGGTFICFCSTLQLGTTSSMGKILGSVQVEGTFNVVNADTSSITSITNDGGTTQFFNGTTASAAIIVNKNGGITNFFNTSSAGTADITNRDGGSTTFNDTSTAANAVITNRAFSITEFKNVSNAGHADITNNGGATLFNDNTNAAFATITNRNGGGTLFFDTSKAGNAIITNRAFSGTSFASVSSADHADITNNGGITLFFDRSTAGFATITNRNGGATVFIDETSADNATITTRNGSITQFLDNSTGGNARFITDLGGAVDFSDTRGPANDGRISAGSIEGGGTYYIGAGNILSVGGNNLSTEVSGVIADFSSCFCGTPGPGTLEKVGAGTLILSGDNTYTGGTRILSGVLQLGNGGTTGTILGDVTNDATFVINRSDVYSFGGVISGIGVFQQNGTGTTVFTAANTYTGGTIVNAGTLQLGPGGSLAPTGALTVNLGGAFDLNGQIQTVGDFSGAGNVLLGAGALTAGTANATTFSGVMSGTGTFTKAGAGTLMFTGTNTYTGATTVADGTLLVNGSIAPSSGLTVNAGATVGGTGTLPTTTIGGTLSPGNSIGTITVSGSLTFVGAGNYLVEVSPTAADRTNVSGAASLSGTVRAAFGPGAYTPRSYTILSAAGGLNGTTFGSLVSTFSAPALSTKLEYTSTDVLLTLSIDFTKVAGLNQNQQATANAIQNAVNAGATLPTPFFALASLPNGALQNALTQVNGEIATGSAAASFRSMDLFLNLMLDPFLETRIADGSVQGRALGFAPEANAALPAAMSAYAGLPTKAPPRASFDQRWTVWGAATGGAGTFKGDAVVGSSNLDVRGGIFAAGIDFRLSPDSVIGIAFAGGTQTFGLDGIQASGRSNSVQGGVYGSTRWGNAYLSAAAAYGRHDLSTERNVAFTGVFDRLTADFRGDSFGGRIEGGYRFAAESFGFTPYTAVQALRFQTPSFGELDQTGIVAFALNYAGQSWNDTRTELGARADYRIMLEHALLTLRGRAAWAHDFDTGRAINAAFQALPGFGFTVIGASPAPDSALVSAGAELKFRNGVALRARFDGEFAGRSNVYAGSGGVYVSW